MSTNVEFDLQSHLAQMEARITLNATAGFKGVNDRLDLVNGRVRRLEDWRNYLVGAWAVISVAGVYIVKKLWT